ncbi:hypothetical protein WA158_008500 [Blastocystis sp. Blastoise]
MSSSATVEIATQEPSSLEQTSSSQPIHRRIDPATEILQAQYSSISSSKADAYSYFDPYDSDSNGLSSREQAILRDTYKYFSILKMTIFISFLSYICSFFEILIIFIPIIGIYYNERVSLKGAVYYLIVSILSVILYTSGLVYAIMNWEEYYNLFTFGYWLSYYIFIVDGVSIFINLFYIVIFCRFITVYNKLQDNVKPIIYNLRDLYK